MSVAAQDGYRDPTGPAPGGREPTVSCREDAMGDATYAGPVGIAASWRRRAVLLIAAAAVVVAGLVVPSTTPASGATNASSYRFSMVWSKGKPVRWDPCTVITWRINYAAGRPYKKELPRVKKAFAELGRATGITFRYLGTSNYAPFTAGAQKEKAKILVGFAKPGRSGLPRRSSVAGLGGAGTGMPADAGGFDAFYYRLPYVAGQAVWDATVVKRLGKGQKNSLYLHELGHVMGLDHASRRSQIMYPSLNSSTPAHYGAGDRAGLKKLGRSQGCVRIPSRPAAPTVTVSGDNLVISVPAVTSSTPVTYRLETLFGYKSSTGTARSWTVPIATVTGGGFGEADFHVTAINYFGERTGPDTTWTAPEPPPALSTR
jgi:hypothetical protein